MKTLEQIKHEYANEKGRDSWEEYFKWLDLCHTPHEVMQKHYDEIAQRYATEYAKEALMLASENAIVVMGNNGLNDFYKVSERSILSDYNLPRHS